MGDLRLCGNCLEGGATAFRVGPDKGTQRDLYHNNVSLCTPCKGYLEAGNFVLFNERFSMERTIRRD